MGVMMKKGNKEAEVNPAFVEDWKKDGWSLKKDKPAEKKAD